MQWPTKTDLQNTTQKQVASERSDFYHISDHKNSSTKWMHYYSLVFPQILK
jgi:hypothetical protein